MPRRTGTRHTRFPSGSRTSGWAATETLTSGDPTSRYENATAAGREWLAQVVVAKRRKPAPAGELIELPAEAVEEKQSEHHDRGRRGGVPARGELADEQRERVAAERKAKEIY